MSPVDPSIALSIRPPQVNTPDTLGKMMQMRREQMQMMLQQREQQIREEEAQRQRTIFPAQQRAAEANATAAEARSRKELEDEADAAVIHKAWGQASQEDHVSPLIGKSIPDRTLEILRDGDQSRAAFKYNGVYLDQQAKAAQRDREMLETEQKAHEQVADMLRFDSDPDRHASLLAMLEGMKKSGGPNGQPDQRWQQAIDEIGPTYDRNRIGALMARGMSAASQNQEAQRAVANQEYRIRLAQSEVEPQVNDKDAYPGGATDPNYIRDKGVYDKTVAENKPKKFALNTNYASNRFARVQNAQDYDATKRLLLNNGIPQDVIDQFGPYNAKFAAHAASVATTVEQDKMLQASYARINGANDRGFNAGLVALAHEQDTRYGQYLSGARTQNTEAQKAQDEFDKNRGNFDPFTRKIKPGLTRPAGPTPIMDRDQWHQSTGEPRIVLPTTIGGRAVPTAAPTPGGPPQPFTPQTIDVPDPKSKNGKRTLTFDSQEQLDGFMKAGGYQLGGSSGATKAVEDQDPFAALGVPNPDDDNGLGNQGNQ